MDLIEKFIDKADINNEIDIMFFNYNDTNKMSYSNFMNMIKYMKVLGKQYKLVSKYRLNIILNINDITHRIEVDTLESINRIINMIKNKPNHISFPIILHSDEKNVKIIKKEKLNQTNIDNYNIRLRESKETDIKKDTDKFNTLTSMSNINFRYIQRYTLNFDSDDKNDVVLDLSLIKTTNDINTLDLCSETYELELDIMKKTKEVNIKNIMTKINNILKVINQSSFILKESTKTKVLDNCMKLFNSNKLQLSQIISLDMNSITNEIINNYCVSYKIDGQRQILFIFQEEVFLISTNFEVKTTNIKVDKKYNNSIIDGELIYHKPTKRYIFFAFDILFDKSKDIRQIENHKERYNLLQDVLHEIFKTNKIKEYSGTFDLDKINDFHKQNIIEYHKKIHSSPDLFTIVSLYIIYPLGGHKCEIFNYSNLLYNFTDYEIDGIIMYQMNAKYKAAKNYKWKPSNLNSIDFYIEIQNDESRIFDKTKTDNLYKICKLFNYKIDNSTNTEYIVEFQIDNKPLSTCYINLVNNQLRDLQNNIITNKIVVEFIYDKTQKTKFKWIPLRIRYDKTDSVKLFNTKHGNSLMVAQHIFKTILEDFTINDIIKLSTPEGFDKYFNQYKSNTVTKDIDFVDTDNDKDNIIIYQEKYHDYLKKEIIDQYTSQINIKSEISPFNVLSLNFKYKFRTEINKIDTKITDLKDHYNLIICNDLLNTKFINENIFNDFIDKLYKSIKQHCYVIFFCYDDKIENMKISYTNIEGHHQHYIEIKKNYTEPTNFKSSFEVNGQVQYLINLNFFIKEMSSKKFKLTETQTFSDIYHHYKIYVDKKIITDTDVVNYYNLSNTHPIFQYTKLLRYYIFQKI